MMHSQPTAPMKSMGSFKSEAEAKTAMAKMKECEGWTSSTARSGAPASAGARSFTKCGKLGTWSKTKVG